jgi:hypothetical protein
MSACTDIFKHALTITGFVAVMMLVVEYVNVLTHGAWRSRLARNRWGQYLLAAFLGATPGCLGAFAVVGMYGHGLLTHGAVIAAMIATMGDESFVMLSMMPGQALLMLGLLSVVGVFVGALADTVARRWIKLTPAACDALEVHTAESCTCFRRGQILRQWKECSAARGLLAVALTLFVLGLASGQLGSPDRQWIRVTLLVVAAVALFIVATVPDHFLEQHLWNHVACKHVPRVFLWTLGALIVMVFLTEKLNLEGALQEVRWILLVVACLVGIIPESGPHLIFVTLYAQGSIPFSILLASSIVQDGHGMLPMLAQSRRIFLAVKTVNFLVGLLVGTLALISGI